MWRLAGCCPLGLGGFLTFFAATQRSAPDTKTTSHGHDSRRFITLCTTSCADTREHCSTLAQPHAGFHSFIQKGHSARAARARTGVTWITTHGCTAVSFQTLLFTFCPFLACFSCRLRLVCCARGSTFPFFFVLSYLLVYVNVFVVFRVPLRGRR